MIAHITGKLISKQPHAVIVDVNGVGYELSVPLSTFYDLGEPGADVSLRVHTHVREDALQLFGFRTDREKQLFLAVTSVTGIGPKLGITLLSGLSADELIRAIRDNNLVKLVAVPGVGKKTAERLVVELRDKMTKLAASTQNESVTSDYLPAANAISEDIISALVNLGYQKAVAEKAVANARNEKPDANFETLLRLSLGRLSR